MTAMQRITSVTQKAKRGAKKNAATLSLLGIMTSMTPLAKTYFEAKIAKEKGLRERNEVAFSDLQDELKCLKDSLTINCNLK